MRMVTLIGFAKNISFSEMDLSIPGFDTQIVRSDKEISDLIDWNGQEIFNSPEVTPLVHVTGYLRIERWTDSKGNQRQRCYLMAESIKVL